MRDRPVSPECSLGLAAATLAVGLLACAGAAREPGTLEEIVDRHVAARGGRAAIEAIGSLEIDLTIVEPSFSATGLYRVDRRGRMRIDIFIAGTRVFSEAFDGRQAWQLGEGATLPEPSPSAKGTAALRNSAQFPTKILGLHQMRSHGHHLALDGRETIDGVRYHVVVLTLDTGETTRYYLDPASFLIVRERVTKALHPDVDPKPTTIETVSSDFRQVDGVTCACRMVDTDLATGKTLQTTTIAALRTNRSAADAIFRFEE